MARKNNQTKFTRPAAQIAAMNLQSVMGHFSALRALPRLKIPKIPRRRIPIVMYGGSPEPVKIRHLPQNLGSVASETRLTQSPRL